jgi:hypothetical protein
MSGFICREVTSYPPLPRYPTSYTPHREYHTVPIIVIEENHAKVVVIEESRMGDGLSMHGSSSPGMLLSCSFEPDLSYTSILCTIIFCDVALYEQWIQLDSKS